MLHQQQPHSSSSPEVQEGHLRRHPGRAGRVRAGAEDQLRPVLAALHPQLDAADGVGVCGGQPAPQVPHPRGAGGGGAVRQLEQLRVGARIL